MLRPGIIININAGNFLDKMIRCYRFEDKPFPYYEFELSMPMEGLSGQRMQA